jgi:hypothetical protein
MHAPRTKPTLTTGVLSHFHLFGANRRKILMILFSAKETPTVTGCVPCNRHRRLGKNLVDFPQYALPKVLFQTRMVRR